jgi:hypothetical protein
MSRLQARANLLPGTEPAEGRDHHDLYNAIGGGGD